MLVPDLLHKFELGVWKAVFMHLICILQAVSSDLVQTLDHHEYLLHPVSKDESHYVYGLSYCQMPTFGRDTIHIRNEETCSLLEYKNLHWCIPINTKY